MEFSYNNNGLKSDLQKLAQVVSKLRRKKHTNKYLF